MRTPCNETRHTAAHQVVAAVLTAVISVCAWGSTRWGGGEGTVIDAETKQPVAGVQVMLWLNTTTYGGMPWLKSATACSVDYLAVSDAQGKFVIPAEALIEPTTFTLRQSMRDFYVMAYKRGYDYTITELTGIGSDPDRGALRRPGPLMVRIEVMKDTQPLMKRVDVLAGRSMAGCGCSSLTRDILNERREIELQAIKEENASKWGDRPPVAGDPPRVRMPRVSAHAARICT